MTLSFEPDFPRHPQDARAFFGLERLYIPGAERVPIQLAGLMPDGKTPYSICRQFISQYGGEEEYVTSQVTVNIPHETLHARHGFSILSAAFEAAQGRTRIGLKLSRLLHGLILLSSYYNLDCEIGFLHKTLVPYLSLSMTFAGREPEGRPKVFISALAELFEEFDNYAARRARPDASAFFGKTKLVIDTDAGRHTVELKGFLAGTETPCSVAQKHLIQINLSAVEIDAEEGLSKLQTLSHEGAYQHALSARLESLSFPAQGELTVRVFGIRERGTKSPSFLRVQYRQSEGVVDRDEMGPILLGALREVLHFCDTVLAERPFEIREPSPAEVEIVSPRQSVPSLEEIITRNLSRGGFYPPQRKDLRPGVPHYEERGHSAIIRILPVALHPAISNFRVREILVRDLNAAVPARLGNLRINFVEDQWHAEAILGPKPLPRPNLSGGLPLFYWQIWLDWEEDESKRAQQLVALDVFLRDYYLTLRTGIAPKELEKL